MRNPLRSLFSIPLIGICHLSSTLFPMPKELFHSFVKAGFDFLPNIKSTCTAFNVDFYWAFSSSFECYLNCFFPLVICWYNLPYNSNLCCDFCLFLLPSSPPFCSSCFLFPFPLFFVPPPLSTALLAHPWARDRKKKKGFSHTSEHSTTL